MSRHEPLPTTLTLITYDDPVVEAHGHHPASAYVDWCWTPVIGPSCVALYRRLADSSPSTPAPNRSRLHRRARHLHRHRSRPRQPSHRHPHHRPPCRLRRHPPNGDALAVRRALPATPPHRANRLPRLSRCAHDLLTSARPEPAMTPSSPYRSAGLTSPARTVADTRSACTPPLLAADSAPAPTADPDSALGRLVATPAAIRALAHHHTDPATLLRRHHAGDWGDADAHDAELNDLALAAGAFSTASTNSTHDTQVWVITEPTATPPPSFSPRSTRPCPAGKSPGPSTSSTSTFPTSTPALLGWTENLPARLAGTPRRPVHGRDRRLRHRLTLPAPGPVPGPSSGASKPAAATPGSAPSAKPTIPPPSPGGPHDAAKPSRRPAATIKPQLPVAASLIWLDPDASPPTRRTSATTPATSPSSSPPSPRSGCSNLSSSSPTATAIGSSPATGERPQPSKPTRRIVPCILETTSRDPRTQIAAQLVENEHRQAAHPVEAARGYQQLRTRRTLPPPASPKPPAPNPPPSNAPSPSATPPSHCRRRRPLPAQHGPSPRPRRILRRPRRHQTARHRRQKEPRPMGPHRLPAAGRPRRRPQPAKPPSTSSPLQGTPIIDDYRNPPPAAPYASSQLADNAGRAPRPRHPPAPAPATPSPSTPGTPNATSPSASSPTPTATPTATPPAPRRRNRQRQRSGEARRGRQSTNGGRSSRTTKHGGPPKPSASTTSGDSWPARPRPKTPCGSSPTRSCAAPTASATATTTPSPTSSAPRNT